MPSLKEWSKEKAINTVRIVLTLALDGSVFLAWRWLTLWIDRLSPEGLPNGAVDPSAHWFRQIADYSTLSMATIYVAADLVADVKDLIKLFKK